MNIKDLPQGSYTEVQPQRFNSGGLNINNLPQGSYTDVPAGGATADQTTSPSSIPNPLTSFGPSSLIDYGKRVGQEYAGATKDIVSNYQRLADTSSQGASFGKVGRVLGETALRTVGDVAGAAFAPITEAVAPYLNPIVEKIASIPGIQGGVQKVSEWTQKHPEAAKDLGAVFNIGALGLGKAVEEPVFEGVGKTLSGLAERMAAKTAAKETAKITEMVAPRLTDAEAEKIGGTAPKGIMGKISANITDRTKQVAEAVKGIVNPSKTFTENAINVEKEITTAAEKLKTDIGSVDHPYTFKELNSQLNKIEIPEFIKTGDKAVQNRAQRIISKFMEIARGKDGNVSSLLDSRKEFDIWVKKEYPRVFDESGNSINTLVKNVRTAGNDFIAEQVPDVAVKDSLKRQNLLYEASDILYEKAARGSPKSAGEIGTNRFGRFATNHPKLTKAAGKVALGAATGLGIGATYEGGKSLLGQ